MGNHADVDPFSAEPFLFPVDSSPWVGPFAVDLRLIGSPLRGFTSPLEVSMNWNTSDRRSRLPSNWSSLRQQVLARDGGRCRFLFPNGGRCPESATDVDHIKRGDDHGLDN